MIALSYATNFEFMHQLSDGEETGQRVKFREEESDAFALDKVRNVTVCLDDYRAMFLEEALNAATMPAELQLIEPYVISAAILLLSTFMY